MRISAKHWFEFLYYSRILLALLAMSLAAACSLILAGSVSWEASAIIGIGTYSLYNIDNLIDWDHEIQKPRNPGGWGRGYVIWCFLTITPALLFASTLVFQSGSEPLYLLSGLSFLSIIHVYLTRRPEITNGPKIWLEPLVVSLVWALAVVFFPAAMDRIPASLQMGRAFIFVWELSIIGVLVKNLSLSAILSTSKKDHSIARLIGEKNVQKTVKLICVLMFLMIGYDTIQGYFPPYNAVLLPVPVAIFLFVSFWGRFREKPALFEILFYFGSIVGVILVGLVYYVNG